MEVLEVGKHQRHRRLGRRQRRRRRGRQYRQQWWDRRRRLWRQRLQMRGRCRRRQRFGGDRGVEGWECDRGRGFSAWGRCNNWIVIFFTFMANSGCVPNWIFPFNSYNFLCLECWTIYLVKNINSYNFHSYKVFLMLTNILPFLTCK